MRVYAVSALTRAHAEFELVNQALWTDPNDQSSWIYHRFLVTKSACVL